MAALAASLVELPMTGNRLREYVQNPRLVPRSGQPSSGLAIACEIRIAFHLPVLLMPRNS